MNKRDLILKIEVKTKLSQSKIEKILNEILGITIEAVSNNDYVHLKGFGRFARKKYKKHKGCNIATGESIIHPEREIPAFFAYKDFKEKIQATRLKK